MFALALHGVIKPLCQQLQSQPDYWAGFYLDDGNAYALLEAWKRFWRNCAADFRPLIWP